MDIKDVNQCHLEDKEGCYHLTRSVHEKSISEMGLGPNIGIRSKDGAGNEKTSKVFFAKSLEGALIFLNRNLNIFYSAAKNNDLDRYKNALSDDNLEEYERIFNENVHENMTEEELTFVALSLGKLYFENGIYYKLDLNYSTREEFDNMHKTSQDEIDYFSDDINEERPDEHPALSNMHTRTGRGVRPDKMTLMTSNGSKSALGVIISMAEKYRSLNPNKPLPVLVHKDGKKDRPLLDILVDRYKTKATEELGRETLEEQKDTLLLDNISNEQLRQERDIVRQRSEGKNSGINLGD